MKRPWVPSLEYRQIVAKRLQPGQFDDLMTGDLLALIQQYAERMAGWNTLADIHIADPTGDNMGSVYLPRCARLIEQALSYETKITSKWFRHHAPPKPAYDPADIVAKDAKYDPLDFAAPHRRLTMVEVAEAFLLMGRYEEVTAIFAHYFDYDAPENAKDQPPPEARAQRGTIDVGDFGQKAQLAAKRLAFAAGFCPVDYDCAAPVFSLLRPALGERMAREDFYACYMLGVFEDYREHVNPARTSAKFERVPLAMRFRSSAPLMRRIFLTDDANFYSFFVAPWAPPEYLTCNSSVRWLKSGKARPAMIHHLAEAMGFADNPGSMPIADGSQFAAVAWLSEETAVTFARFYHGNADALDKFLAPVFESSQTLPELTPVLARCFTKWIRAVSDEDRHVRLMALLIAWNGEGSQPLKELQGAELPPNYPVRFLRHLITPLVIVDFEPATAVDYRMLNDRFTRFHHVVFHYFSFMHKQDRCFRFRLTAGEWETYFSTIGNMDTRDTMWFADILERIDPSPAYDAAVDYILGVTWEKAVDRLEDDAMLHISSALLQRSPASFLSYHQKKLAPFLTALATLRVKAKDMVGAERIAAYKALVDQTDFVDMCGPLMSIINRVSQHYRQGAHSTEHDYVALCAMRMLFHVMRTRHTCSPVARQAVDIATAISRGSRSAGEDGDGDDANIRAFFEAPDWPLTL